MTQDELKQAVGRAAAAYVEANVAPGSVIGVGTGSTANFFIDALAPLMSRYRGAVSSSSISTARLAKHGISVLEPGAVERLPIYVDGADEIDAAGRMIKGGGGALTREKIVASMAETFLCIADQTKRVAVLGHFPLPVEVVPMARVTLGRRLAALGGVPLLRVTQEGAPYITDNGNEILDVRGLQIDDPLALEAQINNWPGVVTVGLFAARRADLCLFGTEQGVEQVAYV